MPANVRASRMPSSSPVITVPMARPPVLLMRQLRGDRHDDVGDRCCQACQHTGEQEDEEAGRQRAGQHGHGDAGKQAHHQSAPLHHIAQWNKQKDAGRVAQLRRHGDLADLCREHVQRVRHLQQERLVVVQV